MTHLAHFNWAALLAPTGDPLVAEFVDNTGRVNAIAERSAGFVWRHGDEDVAGRRIGWPLFTEAPTMIASFSVWESPEAFKAFVYKTVHGAFLRRGAEWFERGGSVNYALWWVPEGHIPSIEEARDRVEQLRAHGPSEAVFTLATLPASSKR
ncbi:DUF3291 domain-containing protein [Flavimaricola marinus]|uniref:DUF3291 domain-containing protein n=1 Tax=Flavimaricola marinus TaxID=1819565 RepID=A0A238LDU7_9RHOB|nr:DUF3291 domain-containing protein [Flavimaricola marinus]SMY07791.1 hypothetical protein LOM8899_01931 [Flavimaricola marinus]